MKRFEFKVLRSNLWIALVAGAALLGAGCATSGGGYASATWTPAKADGIKVVSEKTVTGFEFPESVAYDPGAKVLYVSEFGGTELNPMGKDGKGYIMKVGLDGTILDKRFLPADGVTMNKPKGLWVQGNRLWTTDIDGAWVFDLTTRKGKKIEIPGIQFANDPAVVGNTLYVTDNRGDAVYTVTPADFLETTPKVAMAWEKRDINPNGIAPAKDGSLLLVGFMSDKAPRGIYAWTPGQNPKPLSDSFGRLDGVFELGDGTILATDWNTGSLFAWNWMMGQVMLSQGFKGPADFAAFPNAGGLMVVLPDLVQSQLRFIQLGN